MTKKRFSPGFTLLELLVVVSIIGILIAIATTAFSTAQKKSRDAKRQGDIKSMQSAFEQFVAQNSGSYGASCTAMTTLNGTPILPGGLPTDPKTGTTYSCNSDSTSYCACALLELGGGNSTSAVCTSLTAPSSSNTYYCLGNLQ
jgi:prepilin-type N-terminal cleavage/methylation domain-containing protein